MFVAEVAGYSVRVFDDRSDALIWLWDERKMFPGHYYDVWEM